MADKPNAAPAAGTREWIARFIRTERLRAHGAGDMLISRSKDTPSESPDYATAGCILAAIRELQSERPVNEVKQQTGASGQVLVRRTSDLTVA